MNLVILSGRLTRDPEIQRYEQGEKETLIARYTLAVPRPYEKEDQNNVDYIRCVAFSRRAEFAEKYLHKGLKMTVTGRIQTGSYEASDGSKRYTTDIYVSQQEFAESKKRDIQKEENDYMNIPDGVEDELPFA